MTLRADAHAVLRRWSAPDQQQDRLREVYLAHVDAHPDAMQRACHPDHLTASVLILSADGQHVLLTLHKRLKRWLQTGGHCEEHDVSLVDAAAREGFEESGIHGIDVDPEPVLLSLHEVPCGPVRPAHHLDVQFVGVAPAGAQPVISDESDDLAWFAIDALPDSTNQSVRDLIAAATTRLRGTLSPS